LGKKKEQQASRFNILQRKNLDTSIVETENTRKNLLSSIEKKYQRLKEKEKKEDVAPNTTTTSSQREKRISKNTSRYTLEKESESW
jgi:hypothetical protein